MFELNTKNGIVKVFAETIEQEAISQIYNMANSPIGEDANIRVMPDAHAGAGCTIGTTMKIKDKICPNLVGVDIGCGVDLIKLSGKLENRLDELDSAIREFIPYGMTVHGKETIDKKFFEKMLCWNELPEATRAGATRSLGTLGGGNHFIEAYEGGYISVHSGSRNIGYKVAEYYQKKAIKKSEENIKEEYKNHLLEIQPSERQKFIESNSCKREFNKELCWLEGDDMQNYLHDINIIQEFAYLNRISILATIGRALDLDNTELIATSIHNYIDCKEMILRKGAISAKKGERIVIPLNMRDGVLVCEGKGNIEWNNSAPHGAGRLYSRSKAKELFTVEEYKKAMEGIYTTCISESTLDEAPFAYKDHKEIIKAIEPTVNILYNLKPIYNFKA